MNIDSEIVIYAIIAAVILGRLWSVLGVRNDGEQQRPSLLPQIEKNEPKDAAEQPRQGALRPLPFVPPPNSLAGGLAQVKAVVADFDEKAFLREIRDVFSSVVMAYADGRLSAVSDFLSPQIRAHFQKSVDARAAAGQSASSRITAIKEAETVFARAEGSRIYIAVRFISEQENVLKDSFGRVIGGTEGRSEEVKDTWTFTRDAASPEARWEIVETRV